MKKSESNSFKKSSYCQGCFACVEVSIGKNTIHLRNSADFSKTTITFTSDEWSSFIRGVKNGEFDNK
ncbi:DUF397 domain-containing protein [bacterium]|nr:DUF397 domain-containing protein [bacterium]